MLTFCLFCNHYDFVIVCIVSRGQTLFHAGHYRFHYKRPCSEGLEQFTGLKFTRATSGWWVLIDARDLLSAT